MTRGNLRPGRQQLPDQSDMVERVAQHLEAAATKSAQKVREEEAVLLQAAREAGRKAGRDRGQVRQGPALVSR